MSDITGTNADLWSALAVNDPTEVSPLVYLSRANRPIRITNNILKMLRLANEEFATIQASRQALLDRCVQKDEAGKPVSVDEGRQVVLADPATFTKEFDELMALPFVLRDVRPVTFDDLGDYPISAETLNKLGPFVVPE